jgi:hypothetical protein
VNKEVFYSKRDTGLYEDKKKARIPRVKGGSYGKKGHEN